MSAPTGITATAAANGAVRFVPMSLRIVSVITIFCEQVQVNWVASVATSGPAVTQYTVSSSAPIKTIKYVLSLAHLLHRLPISLTSLALLCAAQRNWCNNSISYTDWTDQLQLVHFLCLRMYTPSCSCSCSCPCPCPLNNCAVFSLNADNGYCVSSTAAASTAIIGSPCHSLTCFVVHHSLQ